MARLVSLLEAGPTFRREVLAAVMPFTGQAHVVGLTGAPGVGKSTLVAALISALRRRDVRVGVLAVDPSSPRSGGALLGDRIRMTSAREPDPAVYIRSMATRGHSGGLAAAVPSAVRVLDAAGYGMILVETAGAGQSEVDVARQADTCVIVLAPGFGDWVRAAKAGLPEVGDVYAVNKADREGADGVVRHITAALHAERNPGAWQPPVVRTVAACGQGVEELLRAVTRHRRWAADRGALAERRRQLASREVDHIITMLLRERIAGVRGASSVPLLAERVVAGVCDPYTAADELLASLCPSGSTGGETMRVPERQNSEEHGEGIR